MVRIRHVVATLFVAILAAGCGTGDDADRLRTGRPILPPMPWQGIGVLSDDDMHALHAYLRTVPPISNAVPEAIFAPPPDEE